jgi:CCR4-NOT complex subunit CAF16
MYVKVKDLNYKFNGLSKNVLNDINLNINTPSRILLAGPNGAGKSTLLRLLGGKHMTHNVKEFSVLGHRAIQHGFNGLAYVGDTWSKSVNFVGYTPYIIDTEVRNFMKKEQDENVERRNLLCKILKINLDWNMSQLSDGQRRRIQIMLGLLKSFKLLLLDEVTAELDIIVRTNLMNFLKSECENNNSTIIYATHILDGLEDWVTEIIYLNHKGYSQVINFNNKEKKLKEIIVSKMEEDYKIMEENNIKEEEARKRKNYEIYGPQGGYSSGRSSNIL